MAQKVTYKFEGESYASPENLTMAEAMFVFEKAKMGIRRWPAAIWDLDPNAVAALIWVVKRRNKEAVKWDDLLDSDFSSFDIDITEVDAEVKGDGKGDGEIEPDPTGSGGKTRKKGTTAT